MIATPKPFASLSSALLARKGQARPAMRRQATLAETGAETGDDLGWNDMGEPAPITQAPHPETVEAPQPEPQVLVEREALAEAIGALASGVPAKSKKAFTLRLDMERHLRLRLAAATQRRSAQQLVTEALDAFLATLPEVEALARRASDGSERSGK
jgi:hypothetical protein